MAITKKRSVLELLEVIDEGDGMRFARYGWKLSNDPTEDLQGPALGLPLDDFEEMGRPEKVTISVDPGDLLNTTPNGD